MSFKFTHSKKEDWGVVWYYYPTNEPFHFAMYFYDDDPKTAYLCNVFVDEKRRGEKLGNKILDMAQSKALEMGCDEMRLKVEDANVFAHNWYKRHGFRDMKHDAKETTRMWMRKSLTNTPIQLNESGGKVKVTMTIRQLKDLISDMKDGFDSEINAFYRVWDIFEKVIVNVDYYAFIRGSLPDSISNTVNDKLAIIKAEQAKLEGVLLDGYAKLGFAPDMVIAKLPKRKIIRLDQVKDEAIKAFELTKIGVGIAKDSCERLLGFLDLENDQRDNILNQVMPLFINLQNQLSKVGKALTDFFDSAIS